MRIIQRQGGGYQKGMYGFEVSADDPLPTVCATQPQQFIIEGAGKIEMSDAPAPASDKPPYRVPSMAEVAAVPWNGLTVASLFAGGGGSSTGYRMAGYRVLWASEFVPAAQDSYRANMRPGTILDGRDVREVQPAEILTAAGLARGDLDVLDGSPPCQAFSTAGKRAKGWGQDKTYEHGAKQRNEDLFQEYVRLLRGLMPRAFVAENVSGLVKGVAKGYFLEILAALKASGYRVEARLLDAQWLGVPQTRQRVIFVGVREDLGLAPAFPSPLPWRYSVRDALPWLGRATFAVGDPGIPQRPGNSFPRGEARSLDLPCPVIHSSGAGAIGGAPTHEIQLVHKSSGFKEVLKPSSEPSPCLTTSIKTSGLDEAADGVRRKFTIAEVMALCSFPPDYVLTGSYAQQWARLGNSVPPLMMKSIAEALRDRVLLPARAAARTAARAARSPGRSTSGRCRKGAAPGPPASPPPTAKRTRARPAPRRRAPPPDRAAP